VGLLLGEWPELLKGTGFSVQRVFFSYWISPRKESSISKNLKKILTSDIIFYRLYLVKNQIEVEQ
jgi:CRISPR/Cas system-associated endoribonuclease Cas2